jgi:flagellar assembly protein FliH
MQEQRPVKFNFDTIFGSKGGPANGSRARSSYSVDEVDVIRRETFAQGKVDAEAQAAAARAAALAAVAQGLDRLLGEFDAAVLAMRQESANVALQVGRKLAHVALDAFPLKEVEALVVDCLHKLHREPRLVVRVSPALADALRTDIEALCTEHGFAGRVVIIAEDKLSGADCRIEWADGGIEHDMAETFAAIEQGAKRWRATALREEA